MQINFKQIFFIDCTLIGHTTPEYSRPGSNCSEEMTSTQLLAPEMNPDN